MNQRITRFLFAALAAAGIFVLLGLGLSAASRVAASLEPLRGLRQAFRLVTRTTPSGPVVLTQIQQLNRLETSRYQGQVVVRGEHSGALPVWLAGDRLLFVGHGEVVAGIDLGRLRAEDVRAAGDRVELRLPPAEVLHTRLDNRQSEVYERRVGLFTGPDPRLEGEVRLEAEERIRAAALESGILTTARANAEGALRRQMEMLGFRQVLFL